jgi:hypothetical protein
LNHAWASSCSRASRRSRSSSVSAAAMRGAGGGASCADRRGGGGARSRSVKNGSGGVDREPCGCYAQLLVSSALITRMRCWVQCIRSGICACADRRCHVLVLISIAANCSGNDWLCPIK